MGIVNLAFILLSEALLPDADDIARAFHEFAAPGETLQADSEEDGERTSGQAISFKFDTNETSIVALMPAPVPNGEADEGAQFSISSFGTSWTLPSHHGHLIVTFHAEAASPPLVRLNRFTSLLAAVTNASSAVGVYWGNAGATHDPEFFLSMAAEEDFDLRMALWSGVSIAREKDGRLSLLSLGMKQFDLPDLLLIAGETTGNAALGTMFDMLNYVAKRGKAIPDGDTVGRTAEEKVRVRYVRSPLDSSTKVWRVELP